MFKIYDKNLYKIGKSINNKSRLNNYNMYYLDNIEVIHISDNNYYNDIAENIIFDILRNNKLKNNREFVIYDKNKIILSINNIINYLNYYYFKNH